MGSNIPFELIGKYKQTEPVSTSTLPLQLEHTVVASGLHS